MHRHHRLTFAALVMFVMIGTRGRLAICETSRFPSMLSHLCRRLPYRSALPAGELNENQKRDGAPQAALS
jgi:hypothetical protein